MPSVTLTSHVMPKGPAGPSPLCVWITHVCQAVGPEGGDSVFIIHIISYRCPSLISLGLPLSVCSHLAAERQSTSNQIEGIKLKTFLLWYNIAISVFP